MNKVLLVGRLTKDPEMRTTQGGVAACTFTVAVDRPFKDKDGNKQADFLPCVAWRNSAEFIGKYFTKGQRIGLDGSIQTRTYNAQDGSKRYVTEIVVDHAEFVERRPEAMPAQPSEGFVETDEPGLPF
jgi:single-strand DNA-binding protein